LPRPTARSGDLDRIRTRAREAVPAGARPTVARVLEAFLDAEVAVYTDFDRIRRPLPDEQAIRRENATTALPGLLDEPASPLHVTRAVVLSGLIEMLIERVPVADPVHCCPTTWRFPR